MYSLAAVTYEMIAGEPVRRFDGDSMAKPLVATPAVQLAPRFSRDGRWLAYSSDESGRQEVYVQAFPGPGRRVQISTDGGELIAWVDWLGEIESRLDKTKK